MTKHSEFTEHKLISLRRLRGTTEELTSLQRIFEETPDYAERVTGAPPGTAEAWSTCRLLPEGKTSDDKFVLGIYRGDALIGCVDLIRRYPTEKTAFVELLFITRRYQHRGIGRVTIDLLEDYVQGWPECERLRLAVVRTNEQVMPFFRRQGFDPTGEVTRYRYGRIVSESVLFEKPVGG